MRRPWVVLLAVVLLSAGCTTIPETGPVVVQPRQVSDPGQGGIQVAPVPPPQGASPAMIVRGFLLAMASFDPTYATARQYLTTTAARTWQPSAEVLVYANLSAPVVTGEQALFQGTLLGRLREDGSFVRAEEPTWSYDFGMVQENGEWRIGSPPPTLLLSQDSFTQSFVRSYAYFFPDGGQTLVPDPRWVPRAARDLTTVAGLVLDGPSDWLAGITRAPAGEGLSLTGPVRLSNQGIADIPLSAAAFNLTPRQAFQLAIEMAATLRGLPGLTNVRLISNNTIIPLPNADANGSLPVSLVAAYDSSSPGVPKQLAGVVDGVIKEPVAPGAVPMPGDWGTTPREITSFAVAGGTPLEVAATTPDELVIGPATPGAPVRSIPLPAGLRPQYDAQGNVWAMSGTDPLQVVYITASRVTTVDAGQLAGMAITGFQVSPDGRRILLIRKVDPAAEDSPLELGVALVEYDQSGPSAIVSWRPVGVAPGGTTTRSVVDAAWLSETSVLILGTLGTTMPGVYSTDLDGLEMEEWGQPQTWTPVQMVVNPAGTTNQVSVLDANGSIWSYQGEYSWTHLAARATAIAFPI